ncbi:protein of unknown function [Candidatus Filomicrobium marinum]|uniref:Uncharacterized protein n=1 Tax=Candidatus Filomicrobium marinum TaxID=1608628 RepID=A0A0D6JCH2_9HYPH|nr:protein of unknown function [Candidatus Filomicrobium marinum]CPR17133.1 protein of unknown function [Candidatus Filomicrobium marinum]
MKLSDTPWAKRILRLLLSSRSRWSRNFSTSVGHSFLIVPPQNRSSLMTSPQFWLTYNRLVQTSDYLQSNWHAVLRTLYCTQHYDR